MAKNVVFPVIRTINNQMGISKNYHWSDSTTSQWVHKTCTFRLEEDRNRIPSKVVELGRLLQKFATFGPGYRGH